MNEDNLKKFRTQLNLYDWNLLDDKDVNVSTERLIEVIKINYESACPLIKRKVNKNKDRQQKWMTDKLMESRLLLKKLAKQSAQGNLVSMLRYKFEKNSTELH